MQRLRERNLREALLRDDVTANNYMALRTVSRTAVLEAADRQDFVQAQDFLQLHDRLAVRVLESPAYQSAVAFVTAETVQIRAS